LIASVQALFGGQLSFDVCHDDHSKRTKIATEELLSDMQ